MKPHWLLPPSASTTLATLALLILTATASAIEVGDAVPIPDSGFENGAASWEIPDVYPVGSLSTDQAASGRASLKIEDSSTERGSNVVSAVVTVPAEGLYELRGKVYPISGNGLGIYVQLYQSNGDQLPGTGPLLELGGTQKRWTPFSARFIVPSYAVKLRIRIHSYSVSTVSAYLDDFEIVLVEAMDQIKAGDLATIKRRLLAPQLRAKHPEEEIRDYVTRLSDDGSWPDIDYADKASTRWKPRQHVSRMLALARYCRSPQGALPGSADIKQAFLRAYDFWMAGDFKSSNWWWNWIGMPNALYPAMLLMEDELTRDQISAGIEILKRPQLEEESGQNLVWVAEIMIASGCLQEDPWVVMSAFNRIAGEIRLSSKNRLARGAPNEVAGLQADFSFYQHGKQLYSGGYGRAFSRDCAKFAAMARGTTFALPTEKLQLLSSYLLDGQQWMVRGPTIDYSTCGREIARKSEYGPTLAEPLERACRSMMTLDSPRKNEFAAFLERLEAGASVPPDIQLTGNRDFWRSEFMTHHRPQFYASVRTTSTQVVQTEQNNDENLHGQLLSDGVMYIMRDGLEYRDIFPVWDWRRLPGITAEQTGESPGAASDYGMRDFVGGVSDGLYGVTAMDFVRSALTAKKSWFFFDREIVCLGTGITCSSDQPVSTSVNQCIADGEVLIADPAGVRALDEATETTESASWVYHDGVAYVFPGAASVRIGNETQTGTWWRINRQYLQEQVRRRVFSLGIDHGVAPQESSYVYVVAPTVAPDTAADYAASLPVQVLENSPALQAVKNTDSGACGIVFWEAGQISLSKDLSVSVDTPCLLLLRSADSDLMLTASNPANEPLDLTVRVSVRLTGEGCTWNAEAGWTQVSFSLPGGMYAGQSVRRRLHCP